MDPFQMVVAIVLITAIASVLRARYGVVNRNKGEHFVGRPGEESADSAAMREEIRLLKERIAVLERLATDSNSAVALDREIERLR
jgi:hypothetical protein